MPGQLKRSPLYSLHQAAGARMTEFAGSELPVQFTSILEEHRAVRASAGLFDVSHLGRLWVRGASTQALLQQALTNDLAKAPLFHSQYTLICGTDGGIRDDLVAFHTGEEEYLLVVNAANTEMDLAYLRGLAGTSGVEVLDRTLQTVMLALQGPEAASCLAWLGLRRVGGLARFGFCQEPLLGREVLVSRTGYTGEDGFELLMEAGHGEAVWKALLERGVKPCGLGARDTLRLEAALPLYGNDIDASTNPYEAGLGFAVALAKGDFVGKGALQKIKEAGPGRRLGCFRTIERGIPRAGQALLKGGREVGWVTSGNYAPSLGVNIGMGYLPVELAQVGTELEVLVRGKPVRAQVVPRPFYKRG